MRAILKLPSLGVGSAPARLAGLLPLSPLIEFTDIVKMLHFYELSGRNIAWNWPITPTGARLLLDHCTADENEVCLYDANGRTTSMQCIDMRWGDHYSCANSYTVRSCIKHTSISKSIIPESNEEYFRRQKVNVMRIFHDTTLSSNSDPESGDVHDNRDTWKLMAIQMGGWAVWLACIVLSVLCACPLTFGYLLTLAVAGLFVMFVFGHRPRRLSGKKKGGFWRRSVVVAEHMNETEWTIFIGHSALVDSLLNKPLPPAKPKTLRRVAFFGDFSVLKLFLKLIVAAQWGLLIAASLLQNWDALLIAVVLMFCACVTTLIFHPQVSIESWLRSNGAKLEKLTVTFSGRRSMLSAMVAINPDRNRMGWIDPILKASDDRSPWEEALKKCMWDDIEPDSAVRWSAAIKEGVKKASIINEWLLDRERVNKEPERQAGQRPFNYKEPASAEGHNNNWEVPDGKSNARWWKQCKVTFTIAIHHLVSSPRSLWEQCIKNGELYSFVRRIFPRISSASMQDTNDASVLTSNSAPPISMTSLSSRHVTSSHPGSPTYTATWTVGD